MLTPEDAAYYASLMGAMSGFRVSDKGMVSAAGIVFAEECATLADAEHVLANLPSRWEGQAPFRSHVRRILAGRQDGAKILRGFNQRAPVSDAWPASVPRPEGLYTAAQLMAALNLDEELRWKEIQALPRPDYEALETKALKRLFTEPASHSTQPPYLSENVRLGMLAIYRQTASVSA